MIPITENTAIAVAALIYNHAYDQAPDSGWMAKDEQSAPADSPQWLGWSTCLIHALQDLPAGTDEQVIAQAAQCIDPKKLGHGWNTIWMQQTAQGDEYSTITEETAVAFPLVRHFLEEPMSYAEVRFIEDGPAYQAYLETPI